MGLAIAVILLTTCPFINASPLWATKGGGSKLQRMSPVPGYYNRGDVPAVQWTLRIEGVATADMEPVVGSSGDIYLVQDNRVVCIPSDGSRDTMWTSAELAPPTKGSIKTADDFACSIPAMTDDEAVVATACKVDEALVLFLVDSSTGTVQTKSRVPGYRRGSRVAPIALDVVEGMALVSWVSNQTYSLSAHSSTSGMHIWSWEGSAVEGPPLMPISYGENTIVLVRDGNVASIVLLSPVGVQQTVVRSSLVPKNIHMMIDADQLYLVGLSAAGEAAIQAFGLGYRLLRPAWLSTGPVPATLPVEGLFQDSGNITMFVGGSVRKYNRRTGDPVAQLELNDFALLGGGLVDVEGNVYGVSGAFVTSLSSTNVQWAYTPLNCSSPQPLDVTPLVMVAGPEGSTTLLATSSAPRSTAVVRISRRSYPGCSTRSKCSCVGSLGPRKCGWCSTTSTCVEVGVDGSAMYDACPEKPDNKGPCPGLLAKKSEELTPGSPPELIHSWRGVAVQDGAQTGEWTLVCNSSGCSFSGPGGYALQGMASHGTEDLLVVDSAAGQVQCTWVSIPNGPQTVHIMLACGGPNEEAPATPDAALCGRNGSKVWILAACLQPAVQHGPCDFGEQAALHTLRAAPTGKCGDACIRFDDCPATCGCQRGTNFGFCCGGGVCPPTPAPPMTRAPTPAPASTGKCGVGCTNNADCSGECYQCVAVSPNPGICGAPCSAACTSDDHCLSPMCPHCVSGTCRAHVNHTCGQSCAVDADCNGGFGLCSSCINSRCGAQCGGECAAHSECTDGSCTYCNYVGQCTATPVKCLGECANDAGCSVDCPVCFTSDGSSSGMCGARCGGTCQSDSQCLDAGCSSCINNICGGPPPPPPTGQYVCKENQCIPADVGYPKVICDGVCGVTPSGQTPGGIIGKWRGIEINKKYSAGEYVWVFQSHSVTVFHDDQIMWKAAVLTLGPGLFFRFTYPEPMLGLNVTAAFGLSQTDKGIVLRAMALANSGFGGDLPYNFVDPMLDPSGQGQYVLFKIG